MARGDLHWFESALIVAQDALNEEAMLIMVMMTEI